VWFFQRNVLYLTASFQVILRAREIHENAPHQVGRDGEKMRTVLPLHLTGVDQPHVGFVNQSRRL
jgi:hypothetical protein